MKIMTNYIGLLSEKFYVERLLGGKWVRQTASFGDWQSAQHAAAGVINARLAPEVRIVEVKETVTNWQASNH